MHLFEYTNAPKFILNNNRRVKMFESQKEQVKYSKIS